MKIMDVQWYSYRLPLLNSFTTAHGVMTAREGIIVQVTTEQGISGIGEIAPLPAFGGGSLADVRSLLPALAARLHEKTLAEALDLLLTGSKAGNVGGDVSFARVGFSGEGAEERAAPPPGGHKGPHTAPHHSRPYELTNTLLKNLPLRADVSPLAPMMNFHDQKQECHPEQSEGSPWPGTQILRFAQDDKPLPILGVKTHYRSAFTPTLCGLEIALLDALGEAEGCGVSTLLSPVGTVPRAKVPVNAVISARTMNAAIAAAREAIAPGFQCVKLKVGLGGGVREEIERVAAVRDAIGPEMHLRLDANEAWNLEEAIAILSQCVPYNIQYVEQPLKAHDLAGMRGLRRAVPIPIAVDEALQGLQSARLVLDNEAADILVIKPQLAGGLHTGQQIIQAATERGVRCVITSAIETGIGVIAALHLAAASPAVTLECGLATLHMLSDDLLIDDLPVRDGFLAVPTGPGLGVALDREALDRYSFRGFA